MAPLPRARVSGGSASPGVAIVVPELDRVGGYELATRVLARALAARGIRVLIVAQRMASPAFAAPPRGGEPFEVVYLEPRSRRTLASMLPQLGAVIRRRRREIDLIHCATFGPLSALAALAGRMFSLPVAVRVATEGDVQEMAGGSGLKGRLLFSLLRGADAFIALSDAIRRELRRHGVPARRIALLPNGVDVERFRPGSAGERADLRRAFGMPPKATIIGCVARLAERKRIDVLLHAFAALRARDARPHLCIVGDGPDRAALHALAATLGVAGDVTWAGEQPDPSPWIRALDVFAFPSRREGSPNAVLEAMATGLPVVACRVGGVVDLVAPERTGLLVPAGDAAAFGRSLATLLEDEALRARLGAAGRARAVERFSIDAATEALLAVFARRCRLPGPWGRPRGP